MVMVKVLMFESIKERVLYEINFKISHFTLEEKLLCFVPIIGLWVDLFTTTYVTKDASSLLIYEANTYIKDSVALGELAFFKYLMWVQLVLFIAAWATILICKRFDMDTKYIYALAFYYFGIRGDGALSWAAGCGYQGLGV
jgi:hypothetical protein